MPSYRRWLVAGASIALQIIFPFSRPIPANSLRPLRDCLWFLVEVILHPFVLLEQEPTVHNLKRVHINFDQLSPRNAVGAVAAENGFVFGWVAIEKLAVLFG